MNIQWDLLGAAPDVGNLFRKGMAEGRETTRGYQQDNALAALAQRPDDPQAMQQLAGINPEAAWKFSDRQAAAKNTEKELIQAQIEARREDIMKAARIIRQRQPKDDAGWQEVLGTAEMAGVNLEGVPRTFDPTYTEQLVTLADTFDPPKGAETPSFIREADALGIPRERARELWERQKGTVVIDGVPHVTTSGASENLPEPKSQAERDALPPGTRYRAPDGSINEKAGGQASAPGNFPVVIDPLAPR